MGTESLTTNVPGVALVFEGGGFRASYTAGIANVLIDQGIYFPFVCGLSAGASHAVDYVSQDRVRVRRSFIDYALLSEHNGVRSLLKGNGYFDAAYDYVGCTQDGFMPYDWATFKANPADVSIQSFQRDTGETLVFRKGDMDDELTMFNMVRMSSTLPGFMHPISYKGEVMMDGGLGEGAGIPTRLAELAGYDRFVLVATRPRGYRKEEPGPAYLALIKSLRHRYPYLAEALYTRTDRYNAEIERMLELEREGRCLIINPESMYATSTTTNVEVLRDSYLLGYEQGVRELPRIREFCFGSPEAGPKPDPAEWKAKIDADRRALERPLDEQTLDPEAYTHVSID